MIVAPHPLEWFAALRWLDGRNLLETIEPYRRDLFARVLYSFNADGFPVYNRVLSGRAKKNFKTADLTLAALYRFLAWPSPAGNDAFIIANDEEQAGDDLSLAKKLLAANPVLGREVKVYEKEVVRRDGGGRMKILPAQDVTGLHGKTYLFLGFDEIHGYRNYDLFEALSPDPTRLDTLIWITSYAGVRHAPGIPLFDMMQIGRSGEDPRLLFTWYGGDFTTDPALAGEDVAPESRANPSMASWGNPGYLEDQRRRLPPHKYRRLHLNLPGAPDGAAFNAENVLGCVVRERRSNVPRRGIGDYLAFVDMSGGSAADAVLCVGHVEEGRIVVDLLIGQTGSVPFNPRDAVRKFVEAMREYRVYRVFGDRFAGETFRADFEELGVRYVVCDQPAAKLYEALEPKVNAGLVELVDVSKLTEQLLSLVVKGGGKIGPLAGDHDDWANAVAGLVYVAAVEEGAPALIRSSALLVDDQPVPMPKWTQKIVSVMVVGKDGLAAIGYFAKHACYREIVDPAPMVLVDGSYEALTSGTIGGMFGTLEALHREIPGCREHFAVVPEAYLQHVHLEGFPALVWPQELLRDLPGLALNAAGHCGRGWFKLAERAASRGLPWQGAMTYRLGERIDDNTMKLMLLIAIRLGLTVESSRHAPVVGRRWRCMGMAIDGAVA